jgi:hypothetical protein
MQKQNRGNDNKNKKCRRTTERNTFKFKVTKRASGRRKAYLSELRKSEWSEEETIKYSKFIRFYDNICYGFFVHMCGTHICVPLRMYIHALQRQ